MYKDNRKISVAKNMVQGLTKKGWSDKVKTPKKEVEKNG